MTDLKESALKWFAKGIIRAEYLKNYKNIGELFEKVWESDKKGLNRPTSAIQCPQCKRPNCFDYDPNYKKRICVWQDCNYVEGEPIKELDDKITEPIDKAIDKALKKKHGANKANGILFPTVNSPTIIRCDDCILYYPTEFECQNCKETGEFKIQKEKDGDSDDIKYYCTKCKIIHDKDDNQYKTHNYYALLQGKTHDGKIIRDGIIEKDTDSEDKKSDPESKIPDWQKEEPLGPLKIPKKYQCSYNPNTYCADHNCETCDFPEAKLKEKYLESQEKIQKESEN